MMGRFWQAWTRLWDLQETAHSMAMVRIALGLAVVYDYTTVGLLGLAQPLYGDASHAGWASYLTRKSPPMWGYLPDAFANGWVLWGLLIMAAVCITIGLYTRTALFVFVLLSAQHAQILSLSDRGIDTIIRNVFLILSVSSAGAVWSVDAWWSSGRWWGDGAKVPAWPRHLVICQLILLYFLAGVSKFGFQWMPWGGHTALFTILQDPAVAWTDFSWMANQPWFMLTQIGTGVTLLWEWTTPLLIGVFYFRYTASKPGKMRAFSNRYRLHYAWAAVGLTFHLGIAVMMQLGIFPWAMLATYFCLIHPDELPLWLKGPSASPPPVLASRPQTAR